MPLEMQLWRGEERSGLETGDGAIGIGMMIEAKCMGKVNFGKSLES